MAAYSYKTAIAFGLVYVPVTLHPCIKENDISFNTLYKKTGERIKYKKTCDNCPATLAPSDIVKGYQYERDKYIILTDAEIEKIKKPKDKSIEIEQFVRLEEIDPIYFDKSYFIKPSSAENAYHLILKAIESENKVGIAKTVLGAKEQVVAIRVINGNMILNTMHFYDEVQKTPTSQTQTEVKENEIKLAKTVIDNMTSTFNPEMYKNEYRERLVNAINDKINGKNIKGEKPIRVNNVINLMEALKKSVETSKPASKSAKATKSTPKDNITKIKRA